MDHNIHAWVDSFIEYYNIETTLSEKDLLRYLSVSIIRSQRQNKSYEELKDFVSSSTVYDPIINKPWFDSALAFATGWIVTYKRIHNGL